jgi:hypothetical protein
VSVRHRAALTRRHPAVLRGVCTFDSVSRFPPSRFHSRGAEGALFGTTSGREQILLTALVALAALWPLRLIGIAAPRAAVPLITDADGYADTAASFYPNSLLLRGEEATLTHAHGLVVEGLTSADALQTTVPEAQDVERQIRRVCPAA